MKRAGARKKVGVVFDGVNGSRGAEALARELGDLMKPERVKAVRILRLAEGMVSGFLLTNCPTENQDHWKDFEAHLGDRVDSIEYLVVDGRRLVTGSTGSRTRAVRHP